MKKKAYVFVFFTILLYAFIFLLQQDFVLTAEDLGRHIILGKIIISCHCIPANNLLSFTNPSFPFINHHWLSEVIFYVLSNTFGLTSLLVFKVGVILFCLLTLGILAKQKGSLFWVLIISLIEIKIFSGRFHVRPELFSFLFITLFLIFFEYYKKTKKIYVLFTLPLIELLWVNLHIYFPVGIAMYMFFLFEQFFTFKSKVDKRLYIILLLLLFAGFANPHGLTGLLLPFTIFNNYGTQIIENLSVWYLTAVGFSPDLLFTFEITVILLAISYIRKLSQRDIFYACFAIFGTIAGLAMIRNFPIFVIASWIPLVSGLTVLEKKFTQTQEKSMVIVAKFFIVLIIFFFTIFIDIWQAYSINAFGFNFLPATQSAVDFIKKNDIHGPYFNNLVIGSYLIYAFYPQEKVFIDARPEAYPVKFFDVYRKMEASQSYFNQQADKYHINALIISRVDENAGNLVPKLLIDPRWTRVYKDSWSYVFVNNHKVRTQ